MKNLRKIGGQSRGGFSLIELLVVIAIIAILAAMLFPAYAWINKKKIIKKAETELAQVKITIELYKEKYNSYPPDCLVTKADSKKHYDLNPLYYELSGSTLASGRYQSMAGGDGILESAVPSIFPGVNGFVNTSRSSAEDAAAAENFLSDMKSDRYVIGNFPSANGVRLLVCSIPWPKNLGPLISNFTPADSTASPNPWRYNSSHPKRNHGSYDLWVDVIINGKTNRINNWGGVEIVSTPYTE